MSEVGSNGREAKRQSDWFGRALAILALVVAGLSCWNSKTALDWQREKDKHQAQLGLTVTTELDRTHVHLSEIDSSWFFDPSAELPRTIYYNGFSLFTIVRLYNESLHPISVDGVRSDLVIDGNINAPEGVSEECYETDYLTAIEFPVVVGSHVQRRLLIKLPWPVGESLYERLRELQPNRLYTGDEIVVQWNLSASSKFVSSVSFRPSLIFLKRNDAVANRILDQMIWIFLATGDHIRTKGLQHQGTVGMQKP